MDTSTTSSNTTILKEISDWENWTIYISAKCAAKECYQALAPFPSKPVSQLTPEEIEEIEDIQKDVSETMKLKAYGIIMPLIDKSLYSVTGKKEMNPRTVIQLLYDNFFLKTGSNLVTLGSQFNRLNMLSGETTAQYAGRIETLTDNMEALGGKIPEHQIIARFIDGLILNDTRWVIFQNNMDSREHLMNNKLKFSEVKLNAAQYETSLKRADDITGQQNKIMYSSQPSTSTTSDKCERCKKTGHTAAVCWSDCIKPPGKKGKKNKPTQNKKKPPPPYACDCGGMHWRSDCTNRNNKDTILFTQQPLTTYVLDTGATCHVVNNKDLLIDSKPATSYVTGIGGHKSTVTAIGTLKDFPGVCSLIPNSTENILSIRQLTSNGWTANFTEGNALLTSPDGRKIMGTHATDSLYRIDDTCYIISDTERHAQDMYNYHCIFGHRKDVKQLRKTANKYGIDTSKWPNELPPCSGCAEGSLKRTNISHKTDYHNHRSNHYKPGQRLNVDLVGPIDNGDYAVDVVDEASRYEMVDFVSHKSKTATTLAKIIDSNYTGHQQDPEELHSDRGGELTGQDMQELCQERHIKHTFTSSYTPEHNGIAERTHGVSINMARAMLAAAKLDTKTFCRQAYTHAVFLRNISTSSALPNGETPYELWHNGNKPRTDNLLPFGTPVLYHTKAKSKFGKRAAPGLYMGPAPNTTGGAIRVHSMETGHEIITRSYKLNQPGLRPSLPSLPKSSTWESDSDSDDEGIASANTPAPTQTVSTPLAPAPPTTPATDNNNTTPTVPDTATAPATAPVVGKVNRELKSLGNISASGFDQPRGRTRQGTAGHILLAISDNNSPHTYKQAMKHQDSSEWATAFRGELIPLFDKNVFTLTPREQIPSHQQPIRSRWVLTDKLDESGNITNKKARLVACGYAQVHGVDFFDVSAPVVRKESMRTLFALAAHKQLHMIQYDFEKAYINADLDTDIYMYPPDGFTDILGDRLSPEQQHSLSSGSAVLKLNKALYGLKQSGLLWFNELKDYLTSIGYKSSESDPCVFYDGKGNFTFVHVDDGIFFATSEALGMEFINMLKRRYSVKCLGSPHNKTVIGLNIDILPDGSIFLHQNNYCNNLGNVYTPGHPPKATPIVFGAALNPDTSTNPGDKQLYMEMIGSLLFASVSTRPDISYAVSAESRFMQRPTKAHLTFARNTINYCKTTADLGLLYTPSTDINIAVYCDSSFAPDEENRKSRSGWLVLVNNAPVAWKSALQPIIAQSTSEAEYISMSDAVREALFIKRLIQELGYNLSGPIMVYEDNTTAITIATEISTKKSKFIELRYHHIRHHVQTGDIKIVYCPTTEMIADLMTKALPKDTFVYLRDRFMTVKGEC